MYISRAQANLQGLDVKSGRAQTSAGGVAMVDSTVGWSNVLIQGNEAPEGGGVVLTNSHVTCKGSVLITENSAEYGGAVWIDSGSMKGAVGTHCLSNTATRNGGAFFVTGDVSLENIKQELNDAPRGGCLAAKSAALSLIGIQSTGCSANTSGGGMLLDDSHVTVDEVSVLSSIAPLGGGLFAVESSVTGSLRLESCAGEASGGGMYLSGQTSVHGVSVHDCDAVDGGAAYVADSTVFMENTNLTTSHATNKGGGLYAVNAKMTLQGFYVLDDHSDSLGGGVYLESSTIEHDGMLIEQCDAIVGGGVYLTDSDVLAMVSSSSSQISGNAALDAGGNMFLSGRCLVEQLAVSLGKADSAGGVAVESGSDTATIQRCSIVNNSAVFGGGIDIRSDSSCVMIDSNVSMNAAEETGGGISIADATLRHDGLLLLSNAAPQGAGMFVTGVASILKQSDSSPQALLQRNSATTVKGYGAGIYVAPSSHVEASGLAFFDGEAYRGAGIYVDGSRLVLSEALFQNGNASSGGGIYASYASFVDLTSCSFVNNNASQSGGAIGSGGFQGGSNTLLMNNCSVLGNSAGVGGGIMLSLTDIDGANNVLTDNIAKTGGAMAVLSEGSVMINNWSFINNTVVKNEVAVQGGTLYITKGVVTIRDSQLVSNEQATLALNGGLIYVENADTTLAIVNSLLEFGQAYSGGLIYSANADISITNSTLHRGFSYDFGAGVFAVNTLLDISDSYFYDNFAFYDGGGIYMKDGGQLTVRDSFFDLNSVQDRGGAIFLSPGAAVQGAVSATNFTRNKNVGFGSTMYVGRKNTVQLTGCIVSGNGGTGTEGGALCVVDAAVNIEDTLFEFNAATKGAAIQLSRSANVAMARTTIRNNSASTQGGALHASVRAVATFTDSIVEANDAGEGGGVYAMGSAAVTLANATFKDNSASSFGGAISMRGSAELTATGSAFERNGAYTGGALSVQGNASLSVSDSRFQDNSAVDFGAGIYIDKDTATKTQTVACETSRFRENGAVAGGDVYWVYYPWFSFSCVGCTATSGTEMISISTSAMAITPGWWPASVTSGVSLGIEVPTALNSSSGTSAQRSRKLAVSSSSSSRDEGDAAAISNSSLAKPGSGVLWPTMVVRDYYGAIASYDNVTRCRASLSTEEEDAFSFFPATWVSVDEGYIVFEDAEVLSSFRTDPYQLNVSCTLSPVLQTPIFVDINVDKCNPGYENVNG
jgi:predicted outer membrane repeat protein